MVFFFFLIISLFGILSSTLCAVKQGKLRRRSCLCQPRRLHPCDVCVDRCSTRPAAAVGAGDNGEEDASVLGVASTPSSEYGEQAGQPQLRLD